MLQFKIKGVKNQNQLLVKIMVMGYYQVQIIDNFLNMAYNHLNLQMKQQNSF